MKDPIVEAVREKLLSRSEVGIKKYGTDMTRTDLTIINWLTHLQEELLDSSVYLERIMSEYEAAKQSVLEATPVLNTLESSSGTLCPVCGYYCLGKGGAECIGSKK
jgi:hypothetical protein